MLENGSSKMASVAAHKILSREFHYITATNVVVHIETRCESKARDEQYLCAQLKNISGRTVVISFVC